MVGCVIFRWGMATELLGHSNHHLAFLAEPFKNLAEQEVPVERSLPQGMLGVCVRGGLHPEETPICSGPKPQNSKVGLPPTLSCI